MTDRVEPGFNTDAESFDIATAISYGGGSDGWIKDGTSPTQASQDESGLTHGNFDAFSETTTGSSLDADISAGEGFVNGAWFARDSTTTVTLSASTNNQTVYVGYNRSNGNTVLVGLSGAFGSGDPKVPVWEFDTDGSGVTASRDQRSIGRTINAERVNSTSSNGSLELDERSSVGDSGKVAISSDAVAHGYVMIQDVTNNTACMVYLGGGANEVEIIHDSGSSNNYTTTEDNDGTTNIYWDSGNGQYELNNETGGSATYAVEVMKA